MASPEFAASEKNDYSREVEELKSRLVIAERKLAETEAKLAKSEANARIDGLTGLRNRKALDEELNQTLGRFRREVQDGGVAEPISLVIVDIDNFKTLNDTYGHQAGDEALKTVAAVLQINTRSTDTVARYGGEEFAIILFGDDGPGALKVTEEVRKKLEEHVFEYKGENIPITASFGIATATDLDEAKPDLLISRADKALYLAKNSGRNRVEVSDKS